ncbi:hypothetical protein BH11ACT4_BH11ACT4_10320 [soil metagenome]
MRFIGLLGIIAGAVFIIGGSVVWGLVATQLSAEKITVSEDSPYLAGVPVADPFTAYAQAAIINHHALEASDGKTYAELDQKDPIRVTVMNASFLRASLFTSVVAFGIAAFAAGLGVLFALFGWVLRTLVPRAAPVPVAAD